MDSAGTEWKARAIPTDGAARTAVATAADGHALRADYFPPAPPERPTYQLVITAAPISFDDGAPAAERWPTIEEMISAADELAPGVVFNFSFFGNPEDVPRVPVPPGTPRSMFANKVGEIRGAGRIQVVGS